MNRLTRTAWGLETGDPEGWRLQAACRGHDPSLWDLSHGAAGAGYRLAHAICGGCPVKAQCLEMGERTNSVGVILGGRDFSAPHQPYATKARIAGRCDRCGTGFTTHNVRRRWCSDLCRRLSYRKP